MAPAHSNMPLPELTTSARTHRYRENCNVRVHFFFTNLRSISLEEEISPFARNGVLSKLVKTVSPYNPYNKIVY